VAIPLIYNVRSLRARWTSTVVAVLGIAGTVGVFVAMLSLARGFEATLVASGSARNAIVRRAGATSEMDSSVMLEQVRVIEDAPGVERGGAGPLVSPEVVVIASFPLRGRDTEGNAQVRGVSPKALAVRPNVTIVAGRVFQPGLTELLVGRNVAASYVGLELGKTVSPAALTAFKDALTADPRVTVQIDREIDYYAKQSRQLTTLITVLGTIVAVVMGIGAVFGALNTMYSAVAERAREIATLRALGFGSGSIVVSFVAESLCIALVGGLLGCLVVLPLNGLTTGTINWQTFSHLAFAFRVTPALMAMGLAFALLMGLVGGVPPAVRASRARIAVALREL
jgi:putative ABC transport system permease protein